MNPRVSIGLPVYNGAKFLNEGIESLLGQAFGDLELIISDNASDDGTAEICQDFVKHDKRVRYVRNSSNLGAAANYQRVFHLAQGEYFKWAAHDDICMPGFIDACLDVLEKDDSVRLAYCKAVAIDDKSRLMHEVPSCSNLDNPDPIKRFSAVLQLGETLPIWGLMRRKELRTTGLLGPFVAHDRPLLAEIALSGKLHSVDRCLFKHREHNGRSVHQFDWRLPRLAIPWYDSSRSPRFHFPAWRLFREYEQAILRAPAPKLAKVRAQGLLLLFTIKNFRQLGGDALTGMVQCATNVSDNWTPSCTHNHFSKIVESITHYRANFRV